MTQEEVWELVTSNERLLRRESRRYLPASRRDELDELYSDVVIARAHDIMATFDPEQGVLPITHLCANIRWYAYKWVHRRCYKYVPPPVDLDKHERGDDGATIRAAETSAEVGLLLRSLPEDAANLLRWHIMMGLTFADIANHYDPPITKAQVKTQFRDALALAYEIGALQNTNSTVNSNINNGVQRHQD